MSVRLGALLSLALAAAVLTACAGNGGRSLSGDEPSPTPSETPPIFQRSPLPASPAASPAASPGAGTPAALTPTPTPSPAAGATPPVEVAVTPVSPFEITVKEAVNIRSGPTSKSDLAAGDNVIYPGFKRKVIGEVRGEPYDPAKGDIWYALEGGGFVYAPLVEKVQ